MGDKHARGREVWGSEEGWLCDPCRGKVRDVQGVQGGSAEEQSFDAEASVSKPAAGQAFVLLKKTGHEAHGRYSAQTGMWTVTLKKNGRTSKAQGRTFKQAQDAAMMGLLLAAEVSRPERIGPGGTV